MLRPSGCPHRQNGGAFSLSSQLSLLVFAAKLCGHGQAGDTSGVGLALGTLQEDPVPEGPGAARPRGSVSQGQALHCMA